MGEREGRKRERERERERSSKLVAALTWAEERGGGRRI